MRSILTVFIFLAHFQATTQTVVEVYPDSLIELVNINYRPGVFYVPKTDAAAVDFMSNSIYQNSIRTHVIESALNSTENLSDCIALLESVETILVDLSNKCQKFIFIFEKMPAWLSSSDNGSPATTPGWYVLNTKKPANWAEWQNVVETITNKIVNDFGIDNAYFEVWNEPDIGSWTDSKTDYLELYKHTYTGVKAVNEAIKVGGPAVNFWANNIYWKPIPGSIPTTSADSSLIADLMEFGVAQTCVPDFVSWHNFSLTYQDFANAANYVQYKCESLGIPLVESILSEWNAPSIIRDTPLAKSFMVKAQLEISATPIANSMIAAWQDFSYNTEEFHNDYGLLSYGAIHKPSYNAIKLTNRLKGAMCKIVCTDPNVILASAFSDTLYLIIANYCPPPLQEAINKTLFDGGFNANDIEDAGLIDLSENDFSELIAVYEGETILPDSSPLNIAVNGAIETYRFYDSVAVYPRNYMLNFNGYTADYVGNMVLVGDQTNNMQFKYDSLLTAGYTQETAIAYIQTNQSLEKVNQNYLGGTKSLILQPNEVVLFTVEITGVGSVNSVSQKAYYRVYPNPANTFITVESENVENDFHLFTMQGAIVKHIQFTGHFTTVDVSNLEKGVYFIRSASDKNEITKFIKQ